MFPDKWGVLYGIVVEPDPEKKFDSEQVFYPDKVSIAETQDLGPKLNADLNSSRYTLFQTDISQMATPRVMYISHPG